MLSRQPGPAVRSVSVGALAVVLAVTLTTGCGGGGAPAADRSPSVVATTTWAAGFARAAGAAEVTVLAPVTVTGQDRWTPTPDDLAAVRHARYLVYAESDPAAAALRDAADRSTTAVPVRLEDTPAAIRAEVTRLGISGRRRSPNRGCPRSTPVRRLTAHLRDIAPVPQLTAVAHTTTGYWAEFAGLRLVGTYGPAAPSAEQTAALAGAHPGGLLASAHQPESAPQVAGARRVDLLNAPGPDQDLLSVFLANTDRLTHAFAS
jgi:zinc transport system substrate-binding protein